MSDIAEQKGRNRGKSSEDDALFSSEKQRSKIREALQDMYYLLSRGYPVKATLALVGNRHRLRARQLLALQGMACSAQEIEERAGRELKPEAMRNKILFIDGFNLLILLETLLSGGYIFGGLDGCYRDVSSVHGTYKKVNQTEEVLLLAGNTLRDLGVQKAVWVFDAPVSNSGRLRALCQKTALDNGFVWEVLLDNAPDKYLTKQEGVVASSDAWVLNHCKDWFNLGAHIVNGLYPDDVPENVIRFEV
ncbi:hypothetical protein AM493_02470 [Flavobacterium akiainvivens]|uniref:DUF434 domain-containing protein n=1 Tax=Flavobacterium akiainvivens TaxID=1202724 RepID=A0A0M8MB67_9FLAO|nr:DUF434 domain-containing protein [Flavobacterium akiainvivens]KOS05024.1 hypothetical protein AM493_02470 [Flavobacterium akiainvivens]SFQ40110.1 hypothetical protein SAMN05444144_10423 [Flavobacterium akiainvivens]